MDDLGKINKCSKPCCSYLEYSFVGFMTGVIQFDKCYLWLISFLSDYADYAQFSNFPQLCCCCFFFSTQGFSV